ncbi:MAG: hypothetical protein AB7T37_00505 [Dehalococcoidia bacterium]
MTDITDQAAVVYVPGGAQRGIVSVGPLCLSLRLFRYIPAHADGTGLERTIAIPYEEIQECTVGGMLARIATTRPWLGLVRLTTVRHGKLVAAIQAMRTQESAAPPLPRS